jgi:hypothetical protein
MSSLYWARFAFLLLFLAAVGAFIRAHLVRPR